MIQRAATRVLAALGALYLMVTFVPVTDWWANALAGTWYDPKGDVLVVLGGDYLADTTIGLHSYWRATYAARAWQAGGVREIVTSGAMVGPAMKKLLVAEGVPAEVIRVEDRSLSTRENALFTKEMVDSTSPRRVVLMTSEFHMFRSRRAFEKVGMTVVPTPIPDVLKQSANWAGRWPAFLELCREEVKTGYYWVRGWV
jgi:uncharacterized SAM-binding protein YcdF (DUF218 family)